MNYRRLWKLRSWVLVTLVFGAALLGAVGSAEAQSASTSCTIDLVADTHTCDDISVLRFLQAPSGGQTALVLDLDPSTSGFVRARFDVTYNAEPTGFTVNIGDSSTNNGGGGDSGTQSNDAEIQVVNRQFAVIGNDDSAPNKTLEVIEGFATNGSTVSFTVANEHVDWRTADGATGALDSPFLFALAGQADREGPVNHDIYAAFNRVIAGTFRSGTGASRVVITLEDESPAVCTRADRSGLSDVAAEVLFNIETNQSALFESPVPEELLLSTCNRFVSVKVDGPDIFEAARDLIAAAEHEVDMAFFVWEPDSDAAHLIGEGLIQAQTRRTADDPLLVRIIINDFNLVPGRKINDLHDSQREWVRSLGLDLSRVELQLGTSEGIFPAPLHDKLIVVDARYVLVTGANVESVHDAGQPWHDSGYVLEGDAAQSALAAFEQSWTHDDAVHWECREETLSRDCDVRFFLYPQPERDWLPPFGSQAPGDVPVLAVGRTKAGFLNNDTDNPQDIAWLTVMDRATSHIHIETPNINDDAFQDAVTRAVAAGVTVRLITSLGFNDGSEDLIGGDNVEAAGRLRQAIRAEAPGNEDRFQLRWYSRDGIEPVTGNGPHASHTKYMTVDDILAIVGAGNQDTASWNISHEFNVLIDDPAVTTDLESSLFLPDWNKAAGSYAELYEGNGGTQDVVCPLFVQQNKRLRFFEPPLDGTDFSCDNDEARSILLHDVPAGKVLQFYDHPRGEYQDDDWTEIIVKRPVSRKYIDTFEQTFEDADVRVIYHRDNGLDGKISFAEVSTTPVGAVVDLYEGNHGTQNLVCSNRIGGTRTIRLTSDPHCENDEARSLVLYDFPPDKVIFLYDSPRGSTGDDWAILVPKRRISQATVPTFEGSMETADYRLCFFPKNGLDGKVSRIRIGDLSEAAGLCGVSGIVSGSAGPSSGE